MAKNFHTITESITKALGKIRTDMPELLQGFNALSDAATKDGVLDKKTKELMALALGVASRCDGCIGFHTKKLVQLNVSKAEILETLAMAVYMGGGPSLMYAADAIDAFEEFSQ